MTEVNNTNDAQLKSLDARIEELNDSADLMLEELILDVTGEICDTMEKEGVSRSELARRIGVKPPHVTRILQGEDNFTMKTLTRIAHSLNRAVRFTLAPRDSTTHFVHSIDGTKETIHVTSNSGMKRKSFRSADFGRRVSLDETNSNSTKTA